MLTRVQSFTIEGVSARRITVEIDSRPRGLPGLTIIGLGDRAVQEANQRVRPAISNSGLRFPFGAITINLAPASLKKIGPGFDLPVAIGLLIAADELEQSMVDGSAFVGELSLAGELRGQRGTLAISQAAKEAGFRRLVIARERANEAALVDGIEIVGIESLKDVAAVLKGDMVGPELPQQGNRTNCLHELDMSEIRGQAALFPALKVAAAGGHNMLMFGSPGTGKTMMARRVPTILPPLLPDDAIKCTMIHSIAGSDTTNVLVTERSFRAPHHSISVAGLVGGGSPATPGEITLAHNGVLFLDELPEFNRSALESLRQPLEDGVVTIVRSQTAARFPSRFMLLAAANPCPCGMGDDRCLCGPTDLARYRRKLSAALLDRIDIAVHVERPSADAMKSEIGESSAAILAQIVEARERQLRRLKAINASTNAEASMRLLLTTFKLETDAECLIADLHNKHRMSARSQTRIIKLACTIADLARADRISKSHVYQAASLRADPRDSP